MFLLRLSDHLINIPNRLVHAVLSDSDAQRSCSASDPTPRQSLLNCAIDFEINREYIIGWLWFR